MTIWQPDISHRHGPRYVAIADAIADAVVGGGLASGDRLPPQRDLAWRLGVTVGTVGRAYLLAAQRGLVEGEIGRGTFVRSTASPAGDELVPPAHCDEVNLTRNAPTTGFYGDMLARTLCDIAARPGLGRLLNYMPTMGHPQHRAAGAAWMHRVGLDVPIERILLSAGSQPGIAVALATLLHPGQTLLTETLTYPGLIAAANLAGLRLHGLPQDEDGLRPDALEAACRDTGATVLFVMPTIQNPTLTMMPEQRRREIAAVARRHDLMVIEDDVYGFLPKERPVPIAALAPERTLYMTSTSKCLAPGLRVAWLVSPPDLVGRLADALHALSVSQPALTAEIARVWIEDGTADRLLDRQRRDAAARQAVAGEMLDGLEFRGHPASLHVFLHLPAPWRADDFAAAARTRGIGVVPAAAFSASGNAAPDAVRISLIADADRDAPAADPDHTMLRRTLGILAELAKSPPPPRAAVI